jgi:hypothetical protein
MKITNLTRMRQVEHLLRRDIKKLSYADADEMIQRLFDAKHKVTVHLYPEGRRKRNPGKLLDLSRDSQIYLAGEGDDFAYLWTDSGSSGRREWHNKMIDFVHNHVSGLRIPTAVVITSRNEILSYLVNEDYAYMDMCIGTNWGSMIKRQLTVKPLPKTSREGRFHDSSIVFEDGDYREVIYKAIRRDPQSEKFWSELGK